MVPDRLPSRGRVDYVWAFVSHLLASLLRRESQHKIGSPHDIIGLELALVV